MPARSAALKKQAEWLFCRAVDGRRLGGVARDLDAHGCAVIGPLLTRGRMRGARRAAMPEDAPFRSRVDDGAARLRARRVQILRLSAARRWSPSCAPRSIRSSRGSPTAGTRRWASTSAIRPSTRSSSSAATRPGRRARRRCCCSTAPATTTACTRTSTASTCFRCRSTVLLSQPGEDFTGGEFVLTEQRPRMQSRAEVVPLRQGEAVIFAVHHRPVQGTRGVYRVNMRHGVSRIARGQAAHARRDFPRREVRRRRLRANKNPAFRRGFL